MTPLHMSHDPSRVIAPFRARACGRYALHHVYYWRGCKFGDVRSIRQTAKLKSSPNFPAIRYNGYCISTSPLYNSQVTESQMGLQCMCILTYVNRSVTSLQPPVYWVPRVTTIDRFHCIVFAIPFLININADRASHSSGDRPAERLLSLFAEAARHR